MGVNDRYLVKGVEGTNPLGEEPVRGELGKKCE
jgi:hypothetical protein